VTVRIFYSLFSLSQKEQDKVRKYHAQGRPEGPIRIKYNVKRMTEDVEAESVGAAVTMALNRAVPLEGVPGVFASYASVFGAGEARDGEAMVELEGAWHATEELLPLQ
jgi:hypothetical protein